jgi:hypothetical protein
MRNSTKHTSIILIRQFDLTQKTKCLEGDWGIHVDAMQHVSSEVLSVSVWFTVLLHLVDNLHFVHIQVQLLLQHHV